MPWKAYKTVPRREGDWPGQCLERIKSFLDYWNEKPAGGTLCTEVNHVCPQKISVQEYFLGNVAEKSQSPETGEFICECG